LIITLRNFKELLEQTGKTQEAEEITKEQQRVSAQLEALKKLYSLRASAS